MKKMISSRCWLTALACLVTATSAFAPNHHVPASTLSLSSSTYSTAPRTSLDTRLFSSSNDSNNSNKSKKPFDEKLRSKLVSEAIAPWRTVRLFLYGSLGSGALVGGLITLSGTAAALSGARTDLDLNTEFLNLAIDFGAVAVFAFLAKWDLDKQQKLDENVQQKIAKKKEIKQQLKGLKERETQLGTLKLQIKVSGDGTTRDASVRELQAGARQHMIVVIGPKKACKDALIGANLLKMDFAMSNVLVVPYQTDVDAIDAEVRPIGTGFGDRPTYETQPYVAQPAGEGWDEWCTAEMNDAIAQNGENAKREGIAIVVANNGKVIRRGVGKVPWRQMVEQLDAEASGTTKKESSSFF